MLLHYSVNAGEASMYYRAPPLPPPPLLGHGKHFGLKDDSGFQVLPPSCDSGVGVAADFGYGGFSTAATTTHAPSHLIERYQKMSMPPLAEGKLGYAKTDYQGLLTLLSAVQDPP